MATDNAIGLSRSARKRLRLQPNRSTTTVGITGTFSAGQVLTANVGDWPPAGNSLSYQWLRGRDPIAGATNSTYTVLAADIGRDILCVVTATSPSLGASFLTLRTRR